MEFDSIDEIEQHKIIYAMFLDFFIDTAKARFDDNTSFFEISQFINDWINRHFYEDGCEM